MMSTTRIRPTYTAAEFLSATGSLLRRPRQIHAIWVGHRVEPTFREELMVSVARANSCRICSYVLREWALTAGLPADELAALEGLEPSEFDPNRWAAIAYVEALAQSQFTSVPEPIEQNFAAHYDQAAREDIRLVAQGMTWANRIGNTIDAFLARLRGGPLPGRRARDDYLVGGLALVAAVPPSVVVALWRRQTPIAVLRDFGTFSRGYEAELRAG